MEKLNQLANIFVIFIRTGTVVRISFSFVKMIFNDDEAPVYKRRIKNALIFYILAELVWQLKDLAVYYFS